MLFELIFSTAYTAVKAFRRNFGPYASVMANNENLCENSMDKKGNECYNAGEIGNIEKVSGQSRGSCVKCRLYGELTGGRRQRHGLNLVSRCRIPESLTSSMWLRRGHIPA